jgi:hypothetical protein
MAGPAARWRANAWLSNAPLFLAELDFGHSRAAKAKQIGS